MAQFNALADYVNYVESQIQESHYSTRNQIFAENETPPDTSNESVQEWLCERQQKIDYCDRRYAVDFQRILRFTVLISIYALVESNLLLLTKEMKKQKKLELDMGDLKGEDLVKRFKKFWEKVANLPYWPDPRWEALKNIQKLRNCIAHKNGVVQENDNCITEIIKKNCGVRLVEVNDRLADPDEVNTLEIEEQFCRQAVEQMTALFKEIFDHAGCFGPDHVVVEEA